MRAKTLIELLTLTTNLYMISKDEDFLETLSEMAKKGKHKVSDFIDELSETEKDDEGKLIEKFLQKAKQARVDLEEKMEEIAVKAYKKMHIAHTDDLKAIIKRLDLLENRLNLLEVKLANPSPKNS